MIVGIGLLLRLGVVLAPFHWQLQHILPDDAFYYFTIARNIAHGNGITFDGSSPTNGFHPLWMGAIVPFWGVLPDGVLPIRGVLLLCGLLDLATIIIFYRLGVLLGWRRSLRWGVPAVHAVSPFLIAHFGTMNGLETSATVMLLSSLLYFYVRLLRSNNPGDWKWLAIAIGLVLLARVDSLFVIAPLLLYLFWSLRPRWRQSCWVAMIPAALLAPWILWSLATFGTIQQSSGRALEFMAAQFLWSDSPSVWEWCSRVADNLTAVLRTIPIPFLGKPLLLFCWVAGAAMVGWWVLSIRRSKPQSDSGGGAFNSVRLVAVLVAGVLLFVVAHTIYGGVMRSWYCTLLYPFIIVVVGIVFNHVLHRRALGRARAWHPAIPAIAVAGLIGLGFWNGWNREGGENLKYRGAITLQQRIESMPAPLRPTAIGAWNAGVVGYFLPGVSVLNLDGVLSHHAIDAAAKERLAEYARANNITLLIDDPETFRVWSSRWRKGCNNISNELTDIDTLAESGRLLLIGHW